MRTVSLYQRLLAAGVEGMSNHYSDLYVPYSRQAMDIIVAYGAHITDIFRDQVTHKLTIDIFGAYDPYWTARTMQR
jgi:hypothetical protein